MWVSLIVAVSGVWDRPEPLSSYLKTLDGEIVEVVGDVRTRFDKEDANDRFRDWEERHTASLCEWKGKPTRLRYRDGKLLVSYRTAVPKRTRTRFVPFGEIEIEIDRDRARVLMARRTLPIDVQAYIRVARYWEVPQPKPVVATMPDFSNGGHWWYVVAAVAMRVRLDGEWYPVSCRTTP